MRPLDSLRSLGVVGGAVAATAVLMLLVRAWLADAMLADGAGVAQRALAGHDRVAAPVERRPVRVVILDGLTGADAHGPALDALCARGMELTIDVGFPTKSLPVQSVLWTGLTAQQSGIAMRNQRAAPLPDALPRKVPGARAVVDGWPSIAAAVGFTPEVPPLDRFAAAAADLVASDAPLVLVHVLAIDEAGHRGGRDARYRAAIANADRLLGSLIERPHAARNAAGARGKTAIDAGAAAWIVLSDHGHVRRGGHGDVEADVRYVRGCVTPRPPGAPASGSVHLVDVSRHLHDTMGIAPPAHAVGRPLAIAALAPDADATLPSAGVARWVAAIVVWLASVILAWRSGRPRVAAVAPMVVAALYVALVGVPSLSWRSPITAAVLGAVTAIALVAPPGRGHPGRVIALVVPWVGVVLGGAILVGMHWTLVGGPPPRLPYVTAAWQLGVSASTVPLLVAVGLVAWVSDTRTLPPDPSGTPDVAGRPGIGR